MFPYFSGKFIPATVNAIASSNEFPATVNVPADFCKDSAN